MNKIIFLVLFFICGCISGEQMSGLLRLKSLAANQAQQEKIIKTQEANFQKLLKYVQKDKLRKGLLKRWILAAFREPSLAKDIENDPVKAKYFMYRHPKNFFGSERVYLYFDKDDKLISWRYEEGY